MLVWFLALAGFGAGLAAADIPASWRRSIPGTRCRCSCMRPGWLSCRLGAVVLAVTGCEALYADMGHFGKRPIQYAWLFVALPALMLNYFGQGAALLRNPEQARHRLLLGHSALGAYAAWCCWRPWPPSSPARP